MDLFGGLGMYLGALGGVLGGILGGLGGLLRGLGGLLGRLGGVLGGLRPAWIHFCRFKPNKAGRPGHVDPQRGANIAPKMGTKTEQNRRQKR